MTRLVNEQNIRTPQRIENRACNDPGILASDMKPISYGLPCMRVMGLEYLAPLSSTPFLLSFLAAGDNVISPLPVALVEGR